MAIIRASCIDCGELELTVADVKVRTSSADDTSTYHFRCPHCAMVMVKPVAARTVDMLIRAGVQTTVWHTPAELKERPTTGPRIDHDDLLDFHELVHRDDVMEVITGSVDVRDVMAKVERSRAEVRLETNSALQNTGLQNIALPDTDLQDTTND